MVSFRIVVAVILCALFAGVAQARSKHPTPSNWKNESRIPQTQTEHGQQPSAADQRGTEQSPVIVKIIGAEPKAQNAASGNPNNGKEKPPTDWWGIGVAGGTLVVLVLQLIAFVVQASRLGQTISVMKDTAERQLRAYVFPIKVGVKLYIGNVPEYRVIIKNSGQTPAYKLRHIDRFLSGEFPRKEPLPDAVSPDFSITNLGPGQKLEKSGIAQRCDGTPVIFTADALEKLKDGTAAIYAFGKIDFVDAFKRNRWIKYRYMTGGDVGFHSDGKLIICQQGNETSED
jgi:hypothetical protein